ncbi:MAG TPA: hypothetical protein VL463_09110 [Kofleriaceae bacterium]|nr:hypothetical protein [Kofleriaceae bacterium]
MSKLKGTIQHTDLEGGMWLLEADDGEKYQLSGHTKGLEAGKRAELDGQVERNQMSFGMGGTIFTVRSVKML